MWKTSNRSELFSTHCRIIQNKSLQPILLKTFIFAKTDSKCISINRMNLYSMKKFYPFLVFLLVCLFTACSESSTMEEPEDTTPDAEQVAEYVTGISEVVDPLFKKCETIEELASHLDKIKKIKGVSDAWTTNSSLFVEVKGGFNLSWLYTPGFETLDRNVTSFSEKEMLVNNAVESRGITNATHQLDGKKTVCIINACNHDDVKQQYRELGNLFEMAGFEVFYEIGNEADRDFFEDTFDSYDIIFLITHGTYDNKEKHWFTSGEYYDDEDFIDMLQLVGYSFYGYWGVETVNEEGKEVKYWKFSENFIKDKMGNLNNAIIFNTACHSLEGNNSVAEILKDKGASVYVGYDATNCQGYNAGITFFENMLKGMTVEQAFEHLPQNYLLDNCPNHKDVPHKANLKLAIPEGNNICIVHPMTKTDTAYVAQDKVTLCGKINDWRVTLQGTAGFFISTNETDLKNHKLNSQKIINHPNGTVELNVELSDWEPNTTYYYQTYLSLIYSDKEEETFYGEVKSFTTFPEEPDEDVEIVEAIDLGLSVKWAPYNVGATKPEEYGGYYAWGETEEKEEYTPETYKYYYDSDGDDYTDEDEFEDLGVDISSTKYDVAHVKWGNGWRMPTKAELKELINKCVWERKTINGVIGRLVTGPNGNSIFLPGSEYVVGTKENFYKTHVFDAGSYWGSEVNYIDTHKGEILRFDDYDDSDIGHTYAWRKDYGCTVRPVKD